MRRWAKRIGLVVAAVLVLPPVLLVGVLLFANIGPGRALIEILVPKLTGGSVVIAGLSGRIPDRMHIARLALHDPDGDWLTAENVAVDVTLTKLLSRILMVDRIVVEHGTVARAPKPSGKPSGSNSLPVRIEIDRIAVARLDIGAALAGKPASVAIEGDASLAALDDIRTQLRLRPLDGTGDYAITAAADPSRLTVQASVDEPAQGLVGSLTGLPTIGAIAAQARLDGSWSAVATHLTLTAGSLRAQADGTIDVSGQAADLTLEADASAMVPRPDLSWQSVALRAKLHGRFAAPDASGTIQVNGLAAAGATVGQLTADVAGNAGDLTADGKAESVTVPGLSPDLFAGAPITLHAHARLDAPDRPVVFSLGHPLVAADGTAWLAAEPRAEAKIALPNLAKLATAVGLDLAGKADLAVRASTAANIQTVEADGTVSITGGLSPVPALVGEEARLGVTATLANTNLSVSRFAFDGRSVTLAASGKLADGALVLDWSASLPDLRAVSPQIGGKLEAKGQAAGVLDDLTLDASASGDIAAAGRSSGALTASLHATGLPQTPNGRLEAHGELDGAPLALALTGAKAADGTLHADLAAADWKSAHAEGHLDLAPGAVFPQGRLAARIARLDDLHAFIGQDIGGALTATADVAPRNGKPVATASLAITGLRVAGVDGSIQFDANGPPEALEMRVKAGALVPGAGDTRLAAAARLDATKSELRLTELTADARGEQLRLLGPSTVAFANGIAVDRVRLGLRQAVVDLAGKLSPDLDLAGSLRASAADLANLLGPGVPVSGTIEADARLTGTPARPNGTVRISVAGLRETGGPAASLPPATLTATVGLSGETARVDARLAAGSIVRLTVTGTAPQTGAGALALAVQGTADVVGINPLIAAEGRRARGQATIDATVSGTVAAPRIGGTLALTGGDVEDVTLGAHLSAISALLRADGDTVRLERLSVQAGPGTITGTGTLRPLAPGLPVDISLTARNARPFGSDRLIARLDADLSVRGTLTESATAAGSIKLLQADVRVPEKLPSSVAVLPNVRVAGVPPPPPAPPPPDIGLDIAIDAPDTITVRGHGLDAILGGKLRIGGTSVAPRVDGAFRLKRGQVSISGLTLAFASGEVTFTGGSSDPMLHFVASRTNGTTTVSLVVSGTASAPKITFESSPDLPQDEILARLLFNQSAVNLNPFQLAQIAGVLAEVSGAGGGFDPFGAVRSNLGLDRLSVEGGSSGSNAQLQAGRYVAPGVYVGAKQAVQGTGSQATVQVDIAKGVKLEADVGTGLPTATGAASSGAGGSFGVTWGFEY